MKDRSWRTGRIGYEIQTRFLIDPRLLRFEPRARKLGARFDDRLLHLEEVMPDRWRWVADPTPPRHYLPDDAPLPPTMRRWFKTDHHERYADSVGYQSYYVYPENDRIPYQLELISSPLEADYGLQDYGRDMARALDVCLPELLDQQIVGVWEGDRDQQLNIHEQVNLELDDERWPQRVDPLQKLAALASGLWLLTKARPRLALGDRWEGALLDHFDEQHAYNLGRPLRFDVFSNVRGLWGGWFGGKELDRGWLERVLHSRALLTILTQCVLPARCTYLVHGIVRISAEEMAEVRVEDFERLRSVGVDPVFLDVFAGEPTEHLLDSTVDHWRVDYHRESMRLFCPMEDIQAFVRATILDRRAPLDPYVVLPLCHPRKHATPRCVYLEFRDLEPIKRRGHPRWPYRYRDIHHEDGAVRIIDPGHVHRLGRDLARLSEVAMAAGRDLLARLRDGDDLIARRDLDVLTAELAPDLRRLLDAAPT